MKPPAVGQPPDLLTLPPSHFCERARWGLDHAGLPYREVALAAGLHAITVRSMAPSSTLPLLRTGAEVVQGSNRILDWCGLPVANHDAEERLQNRIGPLVRSFSYAATLDGPYHSDVRHNMLEGVPGWQAGVATALWPGLRRLLIASLQVQARRLPELTEQLDSELDWFSQHLAGRETLGPGGFGRDDITAGQPARATDAAGRGAAVSQPALPGCRHEGAGALERRSGAAVGRGDLPAHAVTR